MKIALIVCTFIAYTLLIAVSALTPSEIQTFADIVEAVNSDPLSTWNAELGSNLEQKDSISIKNMFGALPTPASTLKKPVKVKKGKIDIAHLPKEFLSSKQWPECANIINTVADQSSCGSCWAVSIASSAQERYCIATKKHVYFSSRDILSCCEDCGDCEMGGAPFLAMDYIMEFGVATGHPDSTNHTLCVAYPFPTCFHHGAGVPQCSDWSFETPQCQESCDHGSTYRSDYHSDKMMYKAKDLYTVYDEENLMAEIYKGGPIVVGYAVYEDFMTYKSGIYSHQYGKLLGGHAVVLTGWSEHLGIKYWIVKNQWGSNWGENGYFRIKRGTNECDIEADAVVGVF